MGVIAGTPAGRVLVVRHSELAALRSELAKAARGLPRFVLVEGESGMGKTAVLDQFATEAQGPFILRGSGEESETQLAYGVVSQLSRSLEVALPPVLRDVAAATPLVLEPFAVGAALLDLVNGLHDRAPVVIVVDDAHLADVPSQLALLFALRRLQSQRAMAIFSTPGDHAVLLRGLRKLIASDAGTTVRLAGLTDAQIRELGALVGVRPLSRSLVGRLRDHTGGNPLHIRELLEHPGADALDRTGHAPLPAPTPYAVHIQTRLDTCTAQARRLLGALAVIGRECEFGLARRLAAVDQPLVALETAVGTGLVEYRERHVRFRSPLVRAAVYHALGIAERAELHGRAASLIDDPATTLRHLAAAATEEDAELASALWTLARSELHRGALPSAATLFMDAARLAPAGAPQGAYVLDAVECLLSGGDVAAAAPLARGLEASADAARAQYLLGRLARLSGRLQDAALRLKRAEEQRPTATEPGLAANVAAELAGLHIHLLRPEVATGWAEAAMRALGGADIAGRTLPHLVLGLAMTGRAVHAVEVAAEFPEPDESLGADAAGVLLARSIARRFSGAVRQAHDDAAQVVRMSGAQSQPLLRVWGLAELAFTEYRIGMWDEAVAHAELGLFAAAEADLAHATATLHAAAVGPLIGLGRWDEAAMHVASGDAAAQSPWDQAMAATGRAVLASGRGRYEDVLEAIGALRALGDPGAVDDPDGYWPWQAMYVDAAVATGRLEDASREFERFEALALARRSALGAASAARVRGGIEMALGNQCDADAAFRRSVVLASRLPGPLYRALAQAAYGAFLRRSGKRSAAVAELRAAKDTFTRLGAVPSVEWCEREMAASGLAPRKRRRTEVTTLTPQESSVARLVAEGKSNRDVASDLVVSVNTVEYHLKNIFAKLGITSRSQLVLRLTAPPADASPPAGAAPSLHGSAGT